MMMIKIARMTITTIKKWRNDKNSNVITNDKNKLSRNNNSSSDSEIISVNENDNNNNNKSNKKN